MQSVAMQDAKGVLGAEGAVSRRSFVTGSALAAAAVACQVAVKNARAVEESEVENWDREADVVVCGAGTAGLPAAIAAHDAGAEVLVVEKKDWTGGQMRRCGGGVAAAGSQVQKALGVEDDPESFYEYWIATAKGLCVPELVKAYCEGSAGLIDWIIDDLGGQPLDEWEFSDGVNGLDCTYGPGLDTGAQTEKFESFGFDPVPRCHWFTQNPEDPFLEDESKDIFPTGGGTGIYKTFAANIESRGIEVMLETEFTRFVTADGSNEVVGVIVKQGEAELAIKARRGVVLATGNFCSNHDMHINFTLADFEENSFGGCACDLEGDDDGVGVNAALALGAGMRFPALPNLPGEDSTDSLTNSNNYMYGGLAVDAETHALDVFGEPIPRLFVSSNAAGGVIGATYPCCGTACGHNLFFGRVAGMNAAAMESRA